MILYRVSGRAEHWPGCGKLCIDPELATSHAEAKKRLKALAKRARKMGTKFELRVEKIDVEGVLNREQLMRLLSGASPEFLVQSYEQVDSISS